VRRLPRARDTTAGDSGDADVALLFVRCQDGVSHNPAESITEARRGRARARCCDSSIALSLVATSHASCRKARQVRVAFRRSFYLAFADGGMPASETHRSAMTVSALVDVSGSPPSDARYAFGRRALDAAPCRRTLHRHGALQYLRAAGCRRRPGRLGDRRHNSLSGATRSRRSSLERWLIGNALDETRRC